MSGTTVELEVTTAAVVRRVELREFTYTLRPVRESRTVEGGPGWWVSRPGPVDGIELELVTPEGLTVVLRFDRGEFVNIATAGLQGLDAADAATEQTEGG